MNPFASSYTVVNDPADFRLPWSMVGATDRDVMMSRYNRLRKQSYGVIVRLGIAEVKR